MAGLFNRFKVRRGTTTGNNHESESNLPSPTFDEEVNLLFRTLMVSFAFLQGFVCPACHQKFADQKQLAQHFTDMHFEEKDTATENKEIHVIVFFIKEKIELNSIVHRKIPCKKSNFGNNNSQRRKKVEFYVRSICFRMCR